MIKLLFFFKRYNIFNVNNYFLEKKNVTKRDKFNPRII